MKAPHRAQHHVHHHHAVGKMPGPPKGVNPGGPVVTGGKGTATGKHHSHNHHKHQPKKPRKWTPDGEVALCAVRAFAESLRLSGRGAVTDSELLAIYRATAADADAGASILATAEAIFSRGLGGHYPLGFAPACPCCAAVLGLDLPGGEPHAVAVGPDGTWWSWGQPFEWPGAVVEEAWAVTW